MYIYKMTKMIKLTKDEVLSMMMEICNEFCGNEQDACIKLKLISCFSRLEQLVKNFKITPPPVSSPKLPATNSKIGIVVSTDDVDLRVKWWGDADIHSKHYQSLTKVSKATGISTTSLRKMLNGDKNKYKDKVSIHKL